MYGKTVYFATENGYIYSLNSEKEEGPASVFGYYLAAIIIAVAGVILVVWKVISRRR
ncbi:hypothetical protein [Methanothermobacter sp. THM-1]|uniref:hypothetical protein n=1 Tax=Methanothermobacter sp. THM-1 TaxID=2606911 RepID=UPI001EE18D9D|nr:hypothetical protein [Methanothermobacter sp. THM-1]